MVTITQRESTQRRLAAQLGLSAEAGPAIEWQTWGSILQLPELDELVPWAAPGWSYLQVPAADTVDRSAVSYNSSGWAVGQAAFGVAVDHPVTTPWELLTALWLRRTVPATAGVNVYLEMTVEQGADVYWNGELVTTVNAGGAYIDPLLIDADRVLATNVLALRCFDDTVSARQGGQTWVDVRLTQGEADTGGGGHELTYAQTVLADLPVGYWRLGEAAAATVLADSSPNARAGTYSGGTKAQAGALTGSGDADTAFLPGAAGYAEVPYGAWLAVTTALSVEAWVKYTGTSSTQFLFARAGGTGYNYGLYVNAGRLNFGVRASTSNGATSAELWNDGAWHHVVGTYDGAMVRLYVDGVQRGTQALTGNVIATANAVRIGNRGGNQFTSGSVDECALYNTVLTPAQVLAHYTAGTVPPTPPADPVDDTPVYVPGWVTHPERSLALTHYVVTYGRSTAQGVLPPLQVATGLARELLDDTALPTAGERFRLTVSDAVAEALGLGVDDRPRFTGEVTDVDTDDRGRVTVTGVGRRRRLSLVPVDPLLPGEPAGARVARVLAQVLTQLSVEVGDVPAGGPQLLPRNDAGPEGTGSVFAAAVLDQIGVDTGGQLVEQRNGVLDWHGPDHRRTSVTSGVLSGAELLAGFRWTQDVASVVNGADVTWGNAQLARIVDPFSAAIDTGIGPSSQQLSTQLANEVDAYARAADVVGRYAWPYWRLPDLHVDVVKTAGAQRADLLALRHGDRVDVSGLPAGGPYDATAAFVEGVIETATRTSWRLQLALSDLRTGGVALRWSDVAASISWASVNPELSWLDLAGVEDDAELT